MSNTYTHTYNKNHPLIQEYNAECSLAQQVEEEYYRNAKKEAKQSGLGGFVALFLIGLGIWYSISVATPAHDRIQPSIGSGVSEIR